MAALGAVAGVSLLAAWALAPGEDSGDVPQADAAVDAPPIAIEPRVRERRSPTPVDPATNVDPDAHADAPPDDVIVVEGLDAATIERSIAVLEAIEIGGAPGGDAWRQTIEMLKAYEGDRRAFIDLALELERTEQVSIAGLLLAALGNVIDAPLTLRLLESVDRLHEPILRRTAILSLAQDRREIGPPPGDRPAGIDGVRWVALASGVHEADVRQRLIARAREWFASDAAEDAPLADAAIEVLRFSVTYPDARNTLLEAIDAPREGVASAAVMALTHHDHGPEVRDALRGAVTSESNLARHARSHAAGALVRRGGEEGVAWVVAQLETAESPSHHLIFGLGGLSASRTSPELIRRARDVLLRSLDAGDPEAQQTAATMLIWKTDPRSSLAADSDEILARVIAFIRDPTRDATARWRVLGQMDTRTATLELGFDAFVEVARDESAPEQVREAALEQIANLAASESSQAEAAEEVLRTYPETTRVVRLREHAKRELARVLRDRE